MVKALLTLLLLNLAMPNTVYSDELEDFRQFYGDEQTIGIATGYARPLADSPSVVSVITADDIKKMGAITIEEVLETVPGFHISSANGFVPAYVIRGIFSPLSSHVLVMMIMIVLSLPPPNMIFLHNWTGSFLTTGMLIFALTGSLGVSELPVISVMQSTIMCWLAWPCCGKICSVV